jgi:transposase
MTAPVPVLIRNAMVKLSEEPDMTIIKVCKVFQVGTATLKRLRRVKRERGTLEPAPRKNGPVGKRTPELMEMFQRLHEAHPDVTLVEMAALWSDASGIRMTSSDVTRSYRDLGITRKKRR